MMSNTTRMTRRQMLGAVMAGASGVAAGGLTPGCRTLEGAEARPVVGDPWVRGPFPILSTKTEEDLRRYWRALAGVAKRPVIIQTTGGTAYKGKAPSVALLVELAREFPHFGYVKSAEGVGRRKGSRL
jgi:hypothetical protein